MNIEQEKMIVESLSSIYPMQKFEEDAIETVLDALPRWIPCSERLPKEECQCLVTVAGVKKMYVSFCEYDPTFGFYPHDADKYISTAFATAWMPLPEPYKGVTT